MTGFANVLPHKDWAFAKPKMLSAKMIPVKKIAKNLFMAKMKNMPILQTLKLKEKVVLYKPLTRKYIEAMDIKLYHDFAVKVAKKAGKILLDYYQTNIQINYKGGDKRNLVTEVDTLAEKCIVDAIKKKFPDHCFLAEEGGDCGIKPSDYKWVIDPIDGTTNYAHGYNFYAVSIALMYKNEVLVGVVYAPMLKELFHAAKGRGAFLNKKRISVSKTADLETSLLSTGFNANEKGRNIPIFKHILPKAQGIRRAGSASLDMAYTAVGRLDGYWEYAIYAWDIAGGVIIVQEAGGKVTDIEGNAADLGSIEAITVLASNGKIHKEMLENIAEGRSTT